MMFSLRAVSLGLVLLASVKAETPIRDLSTNELVDANCAWPNLEVDDELDGVMVLHKGRKLAEWRNPTSQSSDWLGVNYIDGTDQHAQYSVTKTWVSVLIGMLYRDGFLDWETEHPDKLTLGDIFPDKEVWNKMWDIPYLIHGGSKVPEIKSLTLGQLMSMRTGYSETILSSPFDSNLVRDLDGLVAWWHPMYRANKIESQSCFECGDYLASTGILNYIIKELTKTPSNPRGWDPAEYARQTSETLPNGNLGLFEALGMEEGSYTWDRDMDGVARAAFGLWADLEDMARFGQLLLQKGTVLKDGRLREVVPEAYVKEMTTTQSLMIGVGLPMGWQIWTWGYDDNGDSGFCAEGLGWQSICVYPDQETVVAVQAGLSPFGIEAMAANIAFRNEALRRIRNGVVCPPSSDEGTPSPSDPVVEFPQIPPPPPPMEPDNGDNNNDIPTTEEEEESTIVVAEDEEQASEDRVDGATSVDFEESSTGGIQRVGLMVFSILFFAILCCLATLCVRAKKSKRNRHQRRPTPVFHPGVGVHKQVYEGRDAVAVVVADDNSKVSDGTDESSNDGSITYLEDIDIETNASVRSSVESSLPVP